MSAASAVARAGWGTLFNSTLLVERVREQLGGHVAEASHRPHVAAAVDWIRRAQDATGTGGISRGYSLARQSSFGGRGWQPEYPETTGYIIPTLYAARDYLGAPDLGVRALRAAEWERDVQLVNGGVRGGVVGQPETAVVFNTGQVVFGWLAAFAETGDGRFADSARNACGFLVSAMDADGLWRRGHSPFTSTATNLYNARVAWALAEVGVRLDLGVCRDAAMRALRAVLLRRRRNGWLPDCCLTDPARPLLHTIAYAIRGLLEGGRVLGDAQLIAAAAGSADVLASALRPDGFLAGRFDEEWRPAVTWSCLTGEAQMASVWLRLHEITGEGRWIEPAERALRFLKTTQNRASDDDGLRGGIKGSHPVDGEYGRRETLSWAVKFFVDALLRHDRIRSGVPARRDDPLTLA